MKAFPTHKEEGMDLRDYFAAAALVSVTHLNHQKDIARAAYAIADAMMEARK
jgi:hypothetical protein